MPNPQHCYKTTMEEVPDIDAPHTQSSISTTQEALLLPSPIPSVRNALREPGVNLSQMQSHQPTPDPRPACHSQFIVILVVFQWFIFT